MPESVFIETTIPSYYVARQPRDIIQAARQQLTIDWWDGHRSRYELLTSQIVIDELAQGEVSMAQKRLQLLEDVRLLVIDDKVVELAENLHTDGVIPTKAIDDAFHIACAGVHNVDFLLTWNCRHIANPHNRRQIRRCFDRHGVGLPVICTPEELIGDERDS